MENYTIKNLDGKVLTETSDKNLSGMDLRRADFGGMNLIGFNFSNCKLDGSNFKFACLNNSNFKEASIVGAELSQASFNHCIFNNANMRDSNLYMSSFRFASMRNSDMIICQMKFTDFCNADLRGAFLSHTFATKSIYRGANLTKTSFSGAYLAEADFTGAILKNSNFNNATLTIATFSEDERYRLGTILEKDIIAYKNVQNDKNQLITIKLRIPKGAIVFCINGVECRTNKCTVIGVCDKDCTDTIFHSIFNFPPKFTYEVGKDIEIDDFCLQYNVDCGAGIHFFRSLEEENYTDL